MNKPYLIVEIGVNFYDTAKIKNITPMEAAKLYIDEAAKSGVDCVKFQSYKANKIASKNSPAYFDTSVEIANTQYDIFLTTDKFDEKEYRELSIYAHSKGLDFISTPFDYESADYLEPIVDFYKISSSDVSNIPFIKYIGKKGKPVCLSIGASYLSEVDEAVRALKEVGCNDITLFHCILSYPTKNEDANLNVIKTLKNCYPDLKIGYSDHTFADKTMTILTTAYLLGAEKIEKHFTLDKTILGNDHEHAGDPSDFLIAVNNFKLINTIMGKSTKTVYECERPARKYARRSLILTRDIKAGEILTKNDIAAKRPGTGISPKYEDIVIGRKVKKDLLEDTILTWEMI